MLVAAARNGCTLGAEEEEGSGQHAPLQQGLALSWSACAEQTVLQGRPPVARTPAPLGIASSRGGTWTRGAVWAGLSADPCCALLAGAKVDVRYLPGRWQVTGWQSWAESLQCWHGPGVSMNPRYFGASQAFTHCHMLLFRLSNVVGNFVAGILLP